jgi:hypothetical protein
MQLNLSDIWLFLMGFFLLCYAITDGSNLGVGIISLFSRDDEERGLMMGVVSNTWHGNQTWLVLIGGMLFGAFPVFFAILLSSYTFPFSSCFWGSLFVVSHSSSGRFPDPGPVERRSASESDRNPGAGIRFGRAARGAGAERR